MPSECQTFLDQDQVRRLVGPDLGAICLQRLSADGTIAGKELKPKTSLDNTNLALKKCHDTASNVLIQCTCTKDNKKAQKIYSRPYRSNTHFSELKFYLLMHLIL